MKHEPRIVFITGIDTYVGKTVTCGLLARFLLRGGESVITQKLVQTGFRKGSSDIDTHRRIMGIPLTDEDRDGTTCPYSLRFAASPHLAAAREGVRIDPRRISSATSRLAARYDNVLIEGVGGIEVPLTDDLTTLDYVAKRRYDVIVVSSSRLGSINHTLLTLRALHTGRLHVRGIVYNRKYSENKIISEDTRNVLRRALLRHGYPDTLVDLPHFLRVNQQPDVDFSPLFTDSRTQNTEHRPPQGLRARP